MATHLDLEEQEQIDAIKHFWKQWGNLITWVLIVIFGAFAAYNGWQYWERSQASKAALMHDELTRSISSGDVAHIERALADMKDKFSGTAYASLGGLEAAKALSEKGKLPEAKAALAWVAEKGSDAGLKAIAQLRLASLLTGEKAYDEALKHLAGSFPSEFVPLAADRRGDIYLLQGKRAEAASEFGKAYQGLDAASGEYRRLVGIKLNSLGIDPEAGKGGAA
ncbi:YfgM family protein [Ottowia thiooxydans]|uniref:YfgM family protein n=1 Tax=Ottowia thiooxydans TaxID=219182 RepID=UPI0003F98737|nr:tetratricopeptide repeat protein [Ottowia thiooxydans]